MDDHLAECREFTILEFANAQFMQLSVSKLNSLRKNYNLTPCGLRFDI